ADTAELAASYATLEQRLRMIDRSEFEPQAIVEAVGRSPERLSEWVKTQTRLLPYRGALRGSVGVLMDRSGNSLDRSLLLAELIQASGFEVRLANATLSNDQVEAALRQTLAAVPDDRLEPSSDAAKAAQATVSRHTADLLKALGPIPADDKEVQRRRAALADHWWVQRREGENWVDIDIVGLAPTAARTVDFPSADKVVLDDKDCQSVELRVVIEAFRGNKLVTETVLKLPVRPMGLIGRSINFSHFVGEPVKPEDLKNDADALARFKKAMVNQKTYVPTIFIDERSLIDASFTVHGEVEREPQMDRLGTFGNSSNEGFDALAGGGGDAGENPDVLTAEWIEYDIIVPGEPVKTVRREVFDLIGPGARAAGVTEAPKFTDDQKYARSLRLLSNTQILLQPCAIPMSFILYNDVRQELKNKDLVLTLGQTGRDIQQQLDELDARWKAVDTVTPDVALIRAAASGRRNDTFIDQTNVIHHTRWFKETPDGKRVTYAAIDLAHVSTAAAPGASGAFAARVKQGVADTLAEFLAIGEGATGNTIPTFDAAAKKGQSPVTVRPDAAAALDKLEMPADTRARAKADLSAGNTLVLASAESGRWTWWRVDSQSGQTVGVMDSGYNQVFTEREIQEELVVFNNHLGTKMTPRMLRNAKPEQIAKWAKNNQKDMDLLRYLQDDIRLHWEKMAAKLITGM
ncbi:MAG TPA: hypothetical protein VGB55_05250, partial [Tepidisphaeraceae bacterium]